MSQYLGQINIFIPLYHVTINALKAVTAAPVVVVFCVVITAVINVLLSAPPPSPIFVVNNQVLPDFEHAYEQALLEKEGLVSNSCQLVEEMNQEGLSELRSLQRPPPDVEELLVAVITILKGISADVSWTKGAKRIMANLDRSMGQLIML